MNGRDLRVFVAPDGNAFMRDIADWIVEAARQTGREARRYSDGTAPVDHNATNLVVAPHEFFLLGDLDDAAIERAARISVPVCTEQPGTRWFEIGAIATEASPVHLDINRHGVDALQAIGRDARHLRLGGVPSMRAPTRNRDLDVLFLGGATDRRGVELARLAPLLSDRRSDLRVFSFNRPVSDDTPGLVFGADKYALLARSRLLLNLHRDETRPGYFEWARFVEAMANGCCIVTEPVSGHHPFADGEQFVATEDVPATLADLLDDPERCERIGEAAREAVLERYPLVDSLGPILDDLDERAELHRRPVVARRPARVRRRMIVAQQHPLLPPMTAFGTIRERIFRAMSAETLLQRRIERARCLLRHGVAEHVVETATSGYDAVEPEVSVIVTLFNYGQCVAETIESILGSSDISFEIVVVDDHSTDDGRAVVSSLQDCHDDAAILLIGSDVNRGLPASRNLAIERARADKVMVMDADNLVYPAALRRLADALDADPDAAFAYSTLEEFGATTGIRSAMAWNVERLCASNYIDAQAMLRRSAWERHGGYSISDDLIFGWEDWELWLRFAASGDYGIHVPEMLGRYRTQNESMIATTNLVADHMLRHLTAIHPDLPWP